MTSMMDMKEDNVAARVGVQRSRVAETSTVSGARDKSWIPPEGLHWYREHRFLRWIMAGADPIVVQEVLAKIAASDNPRSFDALLDTVEGFRPGNWVFEWSQEAARCQALAKEVVASDHFAARDHLLRASLYYTIASYPHLRGDQLAQEARVRSNHAYREAGRWFPCPLRVLEVPYKGQKIIASLHLPHDDFPPPVVIVCGGGDVLQNGFFHLFDDVLRPAGFAMLTVDMPGVGYSERWPINEDISRLHQAVLEFLPSCPWVDDKKVAMIGLRMGGNIATRLAYLKPDLLKAVVNIGGPLHELFVNGRMTSMLSPMLKDQIASRLYTDVKEISNFAVKAQTFSLVRQGLLSRKCRVPMLAVGMEADEQFPEDDIKRMLNASRENKRLMVDRADIIHSMEQAFTQSVAWLKPYLT
ncbi:alpha/beta fold hydrolase [Corallincola luteus]|uniref:Alpha/beta fold hydrolase n=2 Tax=Corallincola TaxID=1775176 RepID=A0A368NG90_9GAMM|nr:MULTISPECIES: alpha/beta fold hydrolase [Corallincola]RCU49120.1 alpha/beta fold hydrolase [Corallincola holothuriorum]TCI05249.1 alpha/beta fold hydrolase [Corallincola luteus]